LADKAGKSSFSVEDAYDINDLMNKLKSQFTFLVDSRYAIALNQKIMRDNTLLSDGTEIALLPPFAGG
jgi:molybdopterin converting factor small subunit